MASVMSLDCCHEGRSPFTGEALVVNMMSVGIRSDFHGTFEVLQKIFEPFESTWHSAQMFFMVQSIEVSDLVDLIFKIHG